MAHFLKKLINVLQFYLLENCLEFIVVVGYDHRYLERLKECQHVTVLERPKIMEFFKDKV